MIYNFKFRYENCQECAKGSVCAHCQSLIEEKLKRAQGIAGVDVDTKEWKLSIEVDDLTLDELRELLAENGIDMEDA